MHPTNRNSAEKGGKLLMLEAWQAVTRRHEYRDSFVSGGDNDG